MVTALKYMKRKILASRKYRNERDLLDAILDDGKFYTDDEIMKAMVKFKKGRVN